MRQAFGGFPLRAALLGLLALATVITLAMAATKNSSPSGDTAALTSWMRTHAQPFATCEPSDSLADLASLRSIAGDARIVALGEGTHGTREFFQLKHRMVQYLATEMGFNVFAIEANLPEAWRLNDYVLGGAGDVRALIAGMNFWTWDTEEMVAMVEWMRRFNASGRGRIEFTGFDMQFPDSAVANLSRFLRKHEPSLADSLSVIRKLSPPDPGFVTSTGRLPVTEFAGHKISYSGYIRTKDVSNFAGLWLRADIGSTRTVAFDNMRSQSVNGTKDWKRYTIELDIPADADTVRFGTLMSGQGEAWFDSLAIAIDGNPWQSKDLDLDLENPAGPIGMTRKPVHPRFSIALDDSQAKSGKRSLRLTGTPAFAGPDPGFVTATGTLPAGDFAGRSVRYSGWIRTEKVSSFAGLWMRADAPDRRSTAFDNMQSQHVDGTKDWSRYEITLSIPEDTSNINFGVLMSGEGKAWFDGLTIEVDGKPWQSDDIDLDLEDQAGPIGLQRYDKHPRFSVSMDEALAARGTRSLRLTASPPVSDPSQKRAMTATLNLVNNLESSRAELARTSSPEEAGWAIQNAHVFMQSQLKAFTPSGAFRDSCMAANLEWTAEDARKGSKVVIWAHNGHIEKQKGRMGGWLAERYKDDYVAIGFATSEGTYTAVPRTGDKLSDKNALYPGPSGSIEAAAKATGFPRFFLDLRLSRQAPEMEKHLRSPILMRSIGAMETSNQFHATPILDRFDALAWVERTGSSRVFGMASAQLKR